MSSTTSKKDVLLAWLTGGVADVAALKPSPSRATLTKALRDLHAKEKDYKELEDWCMKEHGFGFSFGNSKRGRSAPQAGETRTYKVQALPESGRPFSPVPLSVLGVGKGDGLLVSFEADEIVIRRREPA